MPSKKTTRVRSRKSAPSKNSKRGGEKTAPSPSTDGDTWSVRYGAIDTHDHQAGTFHCLACRAEKKAERVGGQAWVQFCRDIMTALGAVPSKDDDVNERRLKAMGVDIDEASTYWSLNFTGRAYVKLRPKLLLHPSERKAKPVHLNAGDDVAYCLMRDGTLTADPDETTCADCLETAKRKAVKQTRLALPDAKMQVVLMTREVYDRIERWAEACRTGRLDTEKVDDVKDLVYSIQNEMEQWIEVLEEDGR